MLHCTANGEEVMAAAAAAEQSLAFSSMLSLSLQRVTLLLGMQFQWCRLQVLLPECFRSLFLHISISHIRLDGPPSSQGEQWFIIQSLYTILTYEQTFGIMTIKKNIGLREIWHNLVLQTCCMWRLKATDTNTSK